MLIRRCIVLMISAALAASVAGEAGAQEGYEGLICRGVEESGRLYIGQPGFGPHLVSLFVTGPNPLSATHTLDEHMAWANDSLHSYVADGTGALVIWAHPSAAQAADILALDGLAGIEVNYAGDGLSREALWDELLTACADEGRPFLWGYGADDTHSYERANLSWFAARLPEVSERVLKTALRAGGFYASNGPVIDDIQVSDGAISLALGQEADVLWLRAGQHLPPEPDAEVTVSTEPGAGHCLRHDRAVRRAQLSLADAGVSPAELKFVRAVVRTEPTQVAQTQPFRVSADGAIDNPYPPAGEWVRGQTHNHTDAGPGDRTRVAAYRLAYQAFGQLASFSTDYSYWETPHQWLPEDGTPRIEAVAPDRVRQGEAVEAAISGVNLAPGAEVLIAGRPAPTEAADAGLRISVPGDLPPGIHDLTVTNPDGFRDTLAQGFTVRSRPTAQEPDASSVGWRHWTMADGLSWDQCICIECSGDEAWVGTIRGVSRWDGEAWQALLGVPGRAAYGIARGPDGELWFATGGGIAQPGPDGAWVGHAVGQPEKLLRVSSIERWGRLAFDADGQLWVGHRWNGGLGVRRTDGTWERLTTTAGGIPSNAPSAPACDAGGTLWLGFTSGLYRLLGGEWRPVALPEELEGCRFVIALEPAPDGGMWAAVTGAAGTGGVARFDADGGVAAAFTPESSPLPSTRIRDILVTSAGEVWFASDLGLATLAPDGTWRGVTSLTSGLGCNIVLDLAEDASGRIWCATARGVSRFDPGA